MRAVIADPVPLLPLLACPALLARRDCAAAAPGGSAGTTSDPPSTAAGRSFGCSAASWPPAAAADPSAVPAEFLGFLWFSSADAALRFTGGSSLDARVAEGSSLAGSTAGVAGAPGPAAEGCRNAELRFWIACTLRGCSDGAAAASAAAAEVELPPTMPLAGEAAAAAALDGAAIHRVAGKVVTCDADRRRLLFAPQVQGPRRTPQSQASGTGWRLFRPKPPCSVSNATGQCTLLRGRLGRNMRDKIESGAQEASRGTILLRSKK